MTAAPYLPAPGEVLEAVEAAVCALAPDFPDRALLSSLAQAAADAATEAYLAACREEA